MSSVMSVAACRAEAKVVVVLLDAAEASGLISDDELRRRWSDLKGRSSPSDDFVAEAVPLWQLLSDVMRRPEAKGHWIERRWREVETRMRATHAQSRRRTIK